MNELDTYLLRCHRYPAAKTKFTTFRGAFLSALTPRQQRQWSRKALLAELSKRFPIGHDSAGTLIVGELSMIAPPTFKVIDGRLKLQSA